MSAAAIVTLVIAAVLVLALAGYLIGVIRALASLRDTLGKVTFGLRAIAHRTEPVGSIVAAIEEDTRAIDQALTGLVEAKTREKAS